MLLMSSLNRLYLPIGNAIREEDKERGWDNGEDEEKDRKDPTH